MVYTDASTALIIGHHFDLGLHAGGRRHPAPAAPGTGKARRWPLPFGDNIRIPMGTIGEKALPDRRATACLKTQIGQLAGCRGCSRTPAAVCLPDSAEFHGRGSFAVVLLGFLTLNFNHRLLLFVPNRFGLIQMAAYLDGVLLVPLQAGSNHRRTLLHPAEIVVAEARGYSVRIGYSP